MRQSKVDERRIFFRRRQLLFEHAPARPQVVIHNGHIAHDEPKIGHRGRLPEQCESPCRFLRVLACGVPFRIIRFKLRPSTVLREKVLRHIRERRRGLSIDLVRALAFRYRQRMLVQLLAEVPRDRRLSKHKDEHEGGIHGDDQYRRDHDPEPPSCQKPSHRLISAVNRSQPLERQVWRSCTLDQSSRTPAPSIYLSNRL